MLCAGPRNPHMPACARLPRRTRTHARTTHCKPRKNSAIQNAPSRCIITTQSLAPPNRVAHPGDGRWRRARARGRCAAPPVARAGAREGGGVWNASSRGFGRVIGVGGRGWRTRRAAGCRARVRRGRCARWHRPGQGHASAFGGRGLHTLEWYVCGDVLVVRSSVPLGSTVQTFKRSRADPALIRWDADRPE